MTRKDDYEQLIEAIDFYVNDPDTQKLKWYGVLTEALMFLEYNFQEVSTLRRSGYLMRDGKPEIFELYQEYLSEEHMKILRQIKRDKENK